MDSRYFYNLDSLIIKADHLLEPGWTVTMDLFDTLFIRRIPDPDMIKMPVARWVSDYASELGIHTDPFTVAKTRNELEQQQRDKNGKEYPDYEARYDDYMAKMLDNVFGDKKPAGLLNRVTNYELLLEDAVIVVRERLKQWLISLQKRNISVILVSDIYLPSVYLKRLVDQKDLSQYIKDVVSSADTFNAKASGAAFPLLEKKYSLNREKWIHVGDNPHSDGWMPHQYGLPVFIIKDISEKQRRSMANRYMLYARGRNFWKGREVLQYMQPLEAENGPCSALYADGYNYLGFLLGYFIQGIAQRCQELGIKRIYFCSREGWIYKEYWDRAKKILDAHGQWPQASYLYVSRLALAQAACALDGLTQINLTVALLPAQNRDFYDICRIFSLKIEGLQPFLDFVELAADDVISAGVEGVTSENIQKLSRLLLRADFQDEIKRQALSSHKLVIDYFKQEGLFEHQDIALVDIGWLGTIQHYTNRIIANEPNRPNIHGYLFGATRHIPYPNNPQSNTEGIVYDRYKFDVLASLVSNIKDILEEVFRAPHPTVIGYQRNSLKIEPIFRSTADLVGKQELIQDEYYKALRDGILESASRYATSIAITGYNSDQIKPWVNYILMSRIAFPRTSEVKRLRNVTHQDDFSGSGDIPVKVLKMIRGLWGESTNRLRLDPFLRIRYLNRHVKGLLRQ